MPPPETAAAHVPAASVVTLVSGREGHLGALIRGLERSRRPPAELIVVRMNGWRPESPPWTDLDLRFVDAARPGGKLPLAAARNAGARAARSESLVFLDVDCIPSPSLSAAYGDGLAGFDGILMGEVRYLPPGAGDRFRATGDFSGIEEAGTAHPVRETPPLAGVRRTTRYEVFWSLSFAVRRATFLERVGGFDEGYAGYGAEDTDFAFRARRAGVPLGWVGGAAAFHQHHETCDPPLHHLEDIVANARLFRGLWGAWPMGGWLAAFARMGLVGWEDDRLTLLRLPTPEEVSSARRVAPVSTG